MKKNTWLKLAALAAAACTGGGVAALAAYPALQAVAGVAGAVLTAVPTLFADKPKWPKRKKDARGQIDDEEEPSQ